MVPERTQPLSQKLEGYLRNPLFSRQWRRSFRQPIDAVTFDVVDISGEKPGRIDEYQWLKTLVSSMSEKEVERKMKDYRNSFTTIDDAVAEKIIMEAI